jgi:cardiolipin synthase
MPIENNTGRTIHDADSVKYLDQTQARAKDEAASTRGWIGRARLAVWRGWLWLLALLAGAGWQHLVAVIGMAAVIIMGLTLKPKEQPPLNAIEHNFAIESQEFLASISGAAGAPLLPGNSIEILVNGDQFYPRMLSEIPRAQNSITIEAFIYWQGEIGRRFADALAERARSGVAVKILLDAVGSSTIGDEILETLETSGCEVRWYRPIHWYTINRYNNRTHRKSLIIDGRVGFTGGAGIADHWLGNAEGPDHWRDTQIRIEGAAVMRLQNGFAENWLETTGELVSGPAYYPPPSAAGPLAVQAIMSSPDSGASAARIMYYLSIACARKSILISNSYFIPDEQAIDMLVEAKRRGVDVKIQVAGIHNDSMLARANSTRLYGRLLEAGIEIYEYTRTMLHHKYMVCDGVWTTVGTTNFDNRSFALNDESNMCVYDAAFAAEWNRIFFNDLAVCDLVELEQWRDRGFKTKAEEFFASLLRSQV